MASEEIKTGVHMTPKEFQEFGKLWDSVRPDDSVGSGWAERVNGQLFLVYLKHQKEMRIPVTDNCEDESNT
jgi:hypothetical protein